MKNVNFIVQSPINLLEALSEQFPASSKSTVRKWLKGSRIAVNGFWEDDPLFSLKAEDRVYVYSQPNYLSHGVLELYKDRDLIVIYKPEHLLSVALDHKELPHAHGVVKEACPKQKIFVVHRLDEGTSGVMLFARTQEAYQILKNCFYHHELTREYLAIVQGIVKNKGEWKHRLREDQARKVHVCSKSEEGVDALTYFTPLDHCNGVSLLKLKLKTGRKNQIRVQAAHEGFAVVGDRKYGSHMKFNRLCLHASDLVFKHPILDKTLTFHLPVPKAFKRFISSKFCYMTELFND